MPESYRALTPKQKPFAVTTYRVDAEGHLRPDVPDRCPLAVTLDRHEVCCITSDHDRHRKTGPGHPIRVVRCSAHDIAFTLYPPGFAPYRRQSVALVGPDGAQVDTDETFTLKARFSGTLFDAVLDAIQAVAWARDSEGDQHPERWWSTQGRHLSLGLRIVGIASGLADRTREGIARVLGLDTLTILEQLGSSDEGQGYRVRGAAISSILDHLPEAAFAAVALLRCGHWIGQWGEPLHWDSKRRVHDRGPFPASRTSPSP
ncbi:hypothetical protein Poly30_48770 [Planctomycetes bacterium Poly30]|uniref:Uncharacterized protein n=1 Tax=Saltatorellus ferox TaxID=2528018 RepID=A0A518EZ08_9BACT|nr:hypothetical protein Poly30_48770 [Planctomycetes bacterium Poly30]